MKKLLFLIAILILSDGIQAQLLYAISSNGLERPSYIIGTHHLVDASFTTKIVGLEKALRETDQVYGEVVMSDMTNPDSMAALQSLSLLPDGKTLRDVLTADQFTRLDRCFYDVVGAKLSSEQLYAALGRMTPSGLSSYLTVMLYLKNHPGEVDVQNTIDGWFQIEAARNGKYVGGLESIAFQAQLLMQSGNLDEQIVSLMCFVDNLDLSLMMLNDLTDAYHQQDLEGVRIAMEGDMGDGCPSLASEEGDELLYNRNTRWVTLMPAIMKERPTFFAVGAAHLVGPRGVLQMLREAGYTVEGVR